MRPIRGPHHPADDERTVEAPPEEPTLSAGLDVRAAFEAVDITVPGAVVGLVPIEEAEPVRDRTMPLVSPAVVREIQSQARAPAQAQQAQAQPQPEPTSRPGGYAPLPPPSDPIQVATRRDEDPADADDGVEIPGVGSAQRKRMLRIVIGVLSVCGLLCVGAVARQLISGSTTATSTAPPQPTETATTATTASTTPTPATAPSDVASATPSAPAPAPPPSAAVAVATVAPVPNPPPAPPPPRAASPASPPPARAAVQVPPPARRPDPAAAVARSKPAGGAAAKPRPPIVRDAPF